MEKSDKSVTKEIQQLKRSNSKSVVFHKFALLTASKPFDLFCFFEGKDAPYYLPRLTNFYNGSVHLLICGNKKNVIAICEQIVEQEEYNKYKKVYFVDSDFDFPLSEKQSKYIYSTPCYSIENLYVSSEVFSKILKSEFLLTEVDEDNKYLELMQLFAERQNEFHEAVLLFNAWYACLKDYVNKGECKSTNVSLDKKLPTRFIDINLMNVEQNYDIKKIKQEFPEAIEYQQTDLEAKINLFKTVNQSKIFRGKFELDFFCTILELLINDAIQKRKSERKYLKQGTKFRIDKSQIITQLSGYAETPESLVEYIKKTLNINFTL